jgi:hypothetical protein
MNVNFVKEFGKNKYIVVDPNSEVKLKKIDDFSSASTFYIFDPSTNRTKKLSNPQFKELFSSNVKELENLLDLIVKRNIENERTKLTEEFDETLKNIFNEEISKQNFLKFIGTFSSMTNVPDTLNIGDIFEITNNDRTEFYIVLSKDKISRLYTKYEIDEVLSNYYKNAYIDELIDKLKTTMFNQKYEFEKELDIIKTSLNDFITYEDFLALKQKYDDDISDFKAIIDQKYIEQLKSLEQNVNNELLNIKNEANKKLNNLEEQLTQYNIDVQNEVDVFKTETIKFYDNKILELNNTINNLNNKIFELENVLEDILNED